MFDVVALGELLIDFTPINAGKVLGFQQNAGGAPANVVVASAGMGKRTAFIGKIGNDAFGTFLHDTLLERGVDTRGLCVTEEFPTTLAFVHLDDSGERSFSFYRNPSADVMLQTSDLNMDIIQKTKVFHFGAVSLTVDPSRTATLEAVGAARKHGALVTFDPNLRLSLWGSAGEAKTQIMNAIQLADVLKVSEEELTFLTGETSVQAGIDVLRRHHKLALILVTKGPEGCDYYRQSGGGSVPSFPVRAVDTTGAGDAFMGAFIACLLDTGKKVDELGPLEMHHVIQVANASGALTTTKPGGIPALPNRQEVLAFIKAQNEARND